MVVRAKLPDSHGVRLGRAAVSPLPRQQPTLRQRGVVARHAEESSASAGLGVALVEESEPTITVTFLQSDGPDIAINCPSGEQLRAAMLADKVDLYTTWGRIWACGGAGQCGTCIVEVMEGQELLSERTDTEVRKLNKKPESWRLACQTIVGDGSSTGSVKIRTKPQAS